MSHSGSVDATFAGIFQGSQLHGEIADGRTFHCTTSHFETGRSGRQPVQKSVAAAAANDIYPPQLLSRNLRKAAHDFPVPGGKTVENEARHFRRSFSPLRHWLQSAPLELAMDARRHLSRQQQVRVIHIEEPGRRREMLGGLDKLRYSPVNLRRPLQSCIGAAATCR